MGLPTNLRDCNVFNEGYSHLGEVKTVTLPKLERDMNPHRGGGMNGPVKRDKGMKEMDMEWTTSGLNLPAVRQFGISKADGVILRFVGAYDRPDGGFDNVEAVVRGRHEAIEHGDQEAGEETETKVKTALAYYKLTVNGVVEVEIDFFAGIERFGGVDRLEEVRRIVGAN